LLLCMTVAEISNPFLNVSTMLELYGDSKLLVTVLKVIFLILFVPLRTGSYWIIWQIQIRDKDPVLSILVPVVWVLGMVWVQKAIWTFLDVAKDVIKLINRPSI